MWNLSITPMDETHLEEICEDLKKQQETGVSDCAMLMMYFTPEGTPPLEKAKSQCRVYDRFRKKLDAAGVRHGVLVQSTIGHIYPPTQDHPFQHVVSLVAETQYDIYKPWSSDQLVGTTYKPMVCPYDKGFHAYIREQMRELAKHKPSVIMIDDDMGILYRPGIKGCACPLHMAEFNRRAGTKMTREDLIGHIFGNAPEDERYRQIYQDIQGDALVSAAAAMREGIDSVDAGIQGAVSIAANYCEFSEDIAAAFAGKGNPVIARFNNGTYGAASAREFTKNMARAAVQREHLKGKVDVFLAETDTCPHNRYATGAAVLHGHMTGTVLEGAKGAKHWITASSTGFDLTAGKAYREVLAKHRGFYEALARLREELTPVGCGIPLSCVRDYGLHTPGFNAKPVSPWASRVLERYGFPLYFARETGGAAFPDEDRLPEFTDEEILRMLSGAVFLSSAAAKQLIDRGFGAYLGVDVRKWTGKRYSNEKIHLTGTWVLRQMDACELVPLSPETQVLSTALSVANGIGAEELFPAVTAYENSLGGTAVVFCGTPDTEFGYNFSASFLNSARKKQIGDVLRRTGNLPVYFAGDTEMYLRAGTLPDGSLMCAFFNLGLDQLFEIPICAEKPVTKLEMLTPKGERVPCPFRYEDDLLIAETPAYTLMPVVLFLA